MDTIVVHVYYSCKPGQAGAFVRALKDSGAQAAVQAEDGCLRYDYHISCELPDTVVLLEQWRDHAVLEKHMTLPHMELIQKIKAEYVIKTDMERYEQAAVL